MFIANISIAATPDALYDHWQGAKQGETHWNATRIRTGTYKDKSRSEKESWKLCARKSHIPVRSVLHSLLTVLLSNSAFHHLIQWPSENLQRCQIHCLAPKPECSTDVNTSSPNQRIKFLSLVSCFRVTSYVVCQAQFPAPSRLM